MRILSFILKFTLAIIIFGMLGFIIVRELVVYWGASSFKNSLVVLRKSYTTNSHGPECLRRGSGSSQTEKLATYQLRFLSSTEYVLEVVCSQFSLSPVVIQRSSLPPFVTKVPGGSGIVWDENIRSSVEIAAFSDLSELISKTFHTNASFITRTRTVVVDDREIIITTTKTDIGGGPVTSCEGYGYQCCQSVTEVGIGSQITGLNECKDSCFASCGKRPAILSFNSNPYFDAKSRSIEVVSGTVVEFLYVSDGGRDDTIKARLDFGDGAQSNLEGKQGSASHSYECVRSECTYTAILTLTDQWGTQSVITDLSKIKVVVSN